MDSKTYNNIKLASSIGKAVASFLLILWFVLSGLSRYLLTLLQHYSSNNLSPLPAIRWRNRCRRRYYLLPP